MAVSAVYNVSQIEWGSGGLTKGGSETYWWKTLVWLCLNHYSAKGQRCWFNLASDVDVYAKPVHAHNAFTEHFKRYSLENNISQFKLSFHLLFISFSNKGLQMEISILYFRQIVCLTQDLVAHIWVISIKQQTFIKWNCGHTIKMAWFIFSVQKHSRVIPVHTHKTIFGKYYFTEHDISIIYAHTKMKWIITIKNSLSTMCPIGVFRSRSSIYSSWTVLYGVQNRHKTILSVWKHHEEQLNFCLKIGLVQRPLVLLVKWKKNNKAVMLAIK